MLKPIFLTLQERILAAPSQIKHFDWFNNQYAEQDPQNRQQGDFEYPAVFVQFLPVDLETFGQTQKGELTFRLHLVSLNYAHSRAGMDEQSDALKHLDLVDGLYRSIQGFAAKDTQGRQILNTCSRRNLTTDHEQTSQVVNIQEFQTVAFDYAAVKEPLRRKPVSEV